MHIRERFTPIGESCMLSKTKSFFPLALVAGSAITAPALAQALHVIGHTPGRHASSVDRNSTISIRFDGQVNAASITQAAPFKAGEVAMVSLSRNIAACDSIDFNQNGVFPEDQDGIDFFNVLADGACP